MELLLGKETATKIKENLKRKIELMPRAPKLVALVNKEDSSSVGYCASQAKLAANLGIEYELIEMQPDEQFYLNKIKEINEDDNVDACIITRPLFKGANENKIISSLDPNKDVDGTNEKSLGEIVLNKDGVVPATARAIVELIKAYSIDVSGKDVLIVGRSVSVGKPAALLLLNMNATVTIAHSKTVDLSEKLSRADIVIACLGKPHFIDGSKLKKGAIVIDAGIHYLETGIVGDVKPSENLSMISKVPGGVGIITSSCLMDNVYKCYERRHK